MHGVLAAGVLAGAEGCLDGVVGAELAHARNPGHWQLTTFRSVDGPLTVSVMQVVGGEVRWLCLGWPQPSRLQTCTRMPPLIS